MVTTSNIGNLLSRAHAFSSRTPLEEQQSVYDAFRDSRPRGRIESAILRLIPAANQPDATSNTDGETREPVDPSDGGVYDQYRRLLFFIATRTFGIPRDDVEPLAHDAFVAFLRNRHRIGNQTSWLVGVMYNLCRDYWRAKGQEERARLILSASLITPFETASTARVDVDRVLRTLPDRYLAALRMRFFEGLSIEEVADKLGVTPDNAKQIIHRGLRKARQRFLSRCE